MHNNDPQLSWLLLCRSQLGFSPWLTPAYSFLSPGFLCPEFPFSCPSMSHSHSQKSLSDTNQFLSRLLPRAFLPTPPQSKARWSLWRLRLWDLKLDSLTSSSLFPAMPPSDPWSTSEFRYCLPSSLPGRWSLKSQVSFFTPLPLNKLAYCLASQGVSALSSSLYPPSSCHVVAYSLPSTVQSPWEQALGLHSSSVSSQYLKWCQPRSSC